MVNSSTTARAYRAQSTPAPTPQPHASSRRRPSDDAALAAAQRIFWAGDWSRAPAQPSLTSRRSHPSGGGAPQGWPVCVSVCVSVCLSVCLSVCNKKYFQSSALTPFRDLRFETWPRKLCSATLTLSRALEMASRARPQDVSGFRDLGSVSQKSS